MSSILTYPRSVSIELAMFGNWIFTATFAGLPVGDACAASTAEWTCPMDAAAKGSRSNDSKLACQERPSELRRTSCVVREYQGRCGGEGSGEETDLHLPVGHIVRAVLHPPEDVFYLWREDVAILRT